MGRDESASWKLKLGIHVVAQQQPLEIFRTCELRMRLDYGSPLSRNRVIIFLLRRELMVDEAASNLLGFVTRTAESLQCEPEISG